MNMEKQMQEKSSPHGLLAKALSLKGDGQAIVEKDGIFSIKTGLELSGVELDPDLKALVDSVLDVDCPKQS